MLRAITKACLFVAALPPASSPGSRGSGLAGFATGVQLLLHYESARNMPELHLCELPGVPYASCLKAVQTNFMTSHFAALSFL